MAILEEMLKGDRNETDSTGVYICFAVVLGMICLILCALNILRNSIVKYMLKLQLRNIPRMGSKKAVRQESRLVNYHDDEEMPQRNRTLVEEHETIFTSEKPEVNLRRHSARRNRPHSSIHLPSHVERQ